MIKSKLPKLGNVNAVGKARLRKDGELIGYCGDTPNQVAYAFNRTGATMAISNTEKYMTGHTDEDTKENGYKFLGSLRIKNAGYFTKDSQANLTLI